MFQFQGWQDRVESDLARDLQAVQDTTLQPGYRDFLLQRIDGLRQSLIAIKRHTKLNTKKTGVSAMQFEYDGQTYRIEFERKKEQIELIRSGRVKIIQSLHPYTTVRLLKVIPKNFPELFESAKVGCLPIDRFTTEAGRRQALTKLIRKIKKQIGKERKVWAVGLSRVLWKAYLNRPVGPPPEKPEPAAKES